jgi:hypothetical protein
VRATASFRALAADVAELERAAGGSALPDSLWSFRGTIHFVEITQALSRYRARLVPLLTALQGVDVAAMKREVTATIESVAK